jgi:hypothetical protein
MRPFPFYDMDPELSYNYILFNIFVQEPIYVKFRFNVTWRSPFEWNFNEVSSYFNILYSQFHTILHTKYSFHLFWSFVLVRSSYLWWQWVISINHAPKQTWPHYTMSPSLNCLVCSQQRPCHLTPNNSWATLSRRSLIQKIMTLSCSWKNISSPTVWCTKKLWSSIRRHVAWHSWVLLINVKIVANFLCIRNFTTSWS